jgi:choline kinase
MPRIPGFPERPHYNSVKTYLSELAKDIAEMVVDPVKMERFRKQLKIYADFWKQWSTFHKADGLGRWVPSMGRPECIFNIFSRSYNPLRDTEKEAKRLAGSYALCALIHDSQLPHLDKINTDIIPVEAVEETLSAPRNTLEDRIVGNWNSGPDVREIYLIEEFLNRVTVDLQELCKSEENKSTQASIEGQMQQANQLPDEEFLELTAKKFEERAKKVLSKNETWHDLNRSLKGWFDAAVECLKKSDFPENDIGLLEDHYKILLHYTRYINIKSFRGFPDSKINQLTSDQASKLAVKFRDFAQKVKDSLASEKSGEKDNQKVEPEDKIHSSGNEGDNSMKWDVFICHASEDKKNFVEPLANALKEAGIKVWYDRFELKLGDSLRGKIDDGLANSRYGIVVLSSSFFKKEWPKTELDALVSRQNEKGEKTILPIWHRIGREEVAKFSPILASKLAAQSSDSLESIVIQIEIVLNESSTPKKPTEDKRESTEIEQDDKKQEHFSVPIPIAQKVNSSRVNHKAIILAAGLSKRWKKSLQFVGNSLAFSEVLEKIEDIEENVKGCKKKRTKRIKNKPPESSDNHKTFAKINGVPILTHIVRSFLDHDIKLKDMIFVINEDQEDVEEKIRNCLREYATILKRDEPVFKTVNDNNGMVNSICDVLYDLYDLEDYKGNVIISYSDIIWRYELLTKLLKEPANIAVLVDTKWNKNYPPVRRAWHDKLFAEIVFLDGKGNIEKIGETINRYEPKLEWSFDREDKFKEEIFDRSYGEIVGLFKLSFEGANTFLEKHKYIERNNGEFNVKPWDVPEGAQEVYPELESKCNTNLSEALLGSFLEHLKAHIKPVIVKGGWAEIDHWGDIGLAKEKIDHGELNLSRKQGGESETGKKDEQKTSPRDKRGTSETELGNKEPKRKREGVLETKQPEILQKALWLLKYGKYNWQLILLVVFVILIPSLFVLPKIELFSKKPNVKQIETPKPENKTTIETKTSGDSSPAIITSGPNSPVTVNYDLSGNMEEATDIKAKLTNIENKITNLAKQLQPQLAKQYSRTYTAFGVYQGEFVHPNGLMPENLEIDWDTGRVQSINDNMLMVKLPNMTLNGKSFVNENLTFLKKHIGAKSGSIIQHGWFNPILEVIGIDGDLVVVALGFPSDDSKK